MKMSTGSVNFNGYQLCFEKFGTGPHPILLIPGAIGTGRSDFLPQIQGTYALNLKKYTLIAVDPLGWGRSRPPKRTYDSEIYNNDARSFHHLMEELGHSNYSVIGWSDGSRTALLMASLYPSRVVCCIVWGVIAYATEKDILPVVATKNIKLWDKEMIQNYENVYGSEWFKLWERHMEFFSHILELFPDGFVKKEMRKIRCPVLVMHGDQDPMVELEHPHYVLNNISDARLKRFAKGSHNLHQMFPAQFKKATEEFFDEAEVESF